MASGEEGTTAALTCAACGYHMNFNRREFMVYYLFQNSKHVKLNKINLEASPFGILPPFGIIVFHSNYCYSKPAIRRRRKSPQRKPNSVQGTLLAGRDLKFVSLSMSGCFSLGDVVLLLVSSGGYGLSGC